MNTKPVLGFHFHFVWRRLAIAALISSCSIASAQERGDDEQGVVIGTVVVIVADPAEDSGLLRGRKLDEMKWGLMIAKNKVFSFTSKHVDVRSGAEKHFLVKLDAGSYSFEQLTAQGFANFYYPVGIAFDVTPGTTTYIGKLEILLPYRMNDGPAAYNIVDSQAETVDALKDDHPELAAGVTTDLMVLVE
jgi:hypothetical protein